MSSYIRQIKFIREELLLVTQKIRKELKNKILQPAYELLKSIPGIGQVSAAVIQTEVIDINRFKSRDEFISYIGLCPTEQSSGESRKIGHLTRRCNKRLRTIFIEAAWVAVNNDPALGQYYNERVCKIGKHKAIIKVARKLASRARHILMTGIPYQIGVVQ